MERRDIALTNFEEVLAEIDRLHTHGYLTTGNWNLQQILQHLRFTIEGATQEKNLGIPTWLQWIFRKVFLKSILSGHTMRAGFKTAPALMPEKSDAKPCSEEEKCEVEKFRSCIETFLSHSGQYCRNAAFGMLTREEWQKLQLNHANLHLSFLIPSQV